MISDLQHHGNMAINPVPFTSFGNSVNDSNTGEDISVSCYLKGIVEGSSDHVFLEVDTQAGFTAQLTVGNEENTIDLDVVPQQSTFHREQWTFQFSDVNDSIWAISINGKKGNKTAKWTFTKTRVRDV